ncbi:MCE family protein [bacterium]|nr:MCE family protein [bacterium]
MKLKSSSFKVGILTLIALAILIFTILWVKGRAFSSADRIEVHFKDVNGMRAGSGVQMMGLRVGQVEEITPVINGEKSYVKLKFVITEPNITIPKASTLSIQQSGLIGEQFLEITPPKTRTIYLPVSGNKIAFANDPVQIKLDDKFYDVGYIKSTRVIVTKAIPNEMQDKINTTHAYKIDYVVNLPGLILPEFMKGQLVKDNGVNKMRIAPLDDAAMSYPNQTSPYTIIEPMRLSDFMDLQYKAAESLTETNLKVNELLSDKVIADLKQSVVNINELTAQATTTMEKAEKLIETSNKDLDQMVKMADKFTNDFGKITKLAEDIAGDPKFKPTMFEATDALTKLTNNVSKVLDNTDAKQFGADLNSIVTNINEISTSVNMMTKDEKLKTQVLGTVEKVNKAMVDISNALEIVNSLDDCQKKEVSKTLTDVAETAKNLRKFTEKLNKRFLLFRLMF